MTVVEKVNITSGVVGPCQANSGSVPRLGVPSLCYNDGPAGLRYTDFVTQFPSQFTTAMSFDREIVRGVAERYSAEFAGKGVNVQLGPVGRARHRCPFTGRNFEAFSPDPYLSSTLSSTVIRASQSSGLISCAKHYFLYEQDPVCDGPVTDDGHRTDCQQVHSLVDGEYGVDKTIKELYLPSFAEAVRAGVGAVMCSYNQINDTPACQSDDAMNRILKTELNFQGFVLSDFGATHSTVESINAGMDQELPGTWFCGFECDVAPNPPVGDRLLKALKDGKVKEKRLDDMAVRILTPWIAFGQADKWNVVNYQMYNLGDEVYVGRHTFRNQHVDPRREDSAEFARKAAEQSHVLLKNDGVLPLKKSVRRIGVFGSDADYPITVSGCGPDMWCTTETKRMHWNGTVTIGGGSGATYPNYVVPPIEAISRRGRETGMRVDHVLRDEKAFYGTIANVAIASEVCLVFVSVFQYESWDRSTLRLDRDGEELIKHVANKCAGDVVVVIHSGGQVLVEDWIDLPKVKGVIFAGYPGQETGNALANVLWGDVNPSAKLAFTMGRKESDWPPNSIVRKIKKGDAPRLHFAEGVAIDYKWFDKHYIDPRFEFGFGLSYTSFKLADLKVEAKYSPVQDTIQQTNEQHEGRYDLYDVLLEASVSVSNTGDVFGGEAPQLYMSFPDGEKGQPPRHLRGYTKVWLEPGETKRVTFPLRKKDVSVWDVKRQLWHIPKGTFTFSAGHSSRQLVLEKRTGIEI
ncbi:hypothetical protein VHUM_00069 [Vanrija humicola]|uniref:Probable beta-glucosidase G n=1 Tax=Vanrija humicola TaxID=5417 RepID=A0A7D8ZAJ9_VANHU|nr:hypothetical protein VHUM_00069 [Vanrija humicola]